MYIYIICYSHGKCGFLIRRHRPIGSLKYPGPHFRLAVLFVAVEDAVAKAVLTADGDWPGAGGDEDVVTAFADDGGCSVGKSEVFPLLAIKASTIWTILSLLDCEYGSNNANAGELVLTTAAVATVLDVGA